MEKQVGQVPTYRPSHWGLGRPGTSSKFVILGLVRLMLCSTPAAGQSQVFQAWVSRNDSLFSGFQSRLKALQRSFEGEWSLFPEEILMFGSGDCEDRAALFSVLLMTTLGEPSVGLRYVNHVAIGLESKGPLSSLRNYTLSGVPYAVANLTYLGSDVGMVIPELTEERPEIIHSRQ